MNSITNNTAILRLSASVILFVALAACVLSTRAEPAKRIPDVYIYSADFDIVRVCCEVRNVDELLELDGTVEWRSSDNKRTECLIGPPESIDAFNALHPYLSRAGQGFFNDGQVYVKIVNHTAGQETYIDKVGGIYTFGDTTTRKLTLADAFEMRKIINRARQAHCVKK